jgi:hypothetical protein
MLQDQSPHNRIAASIRQKIGNVGAIEHHIRKLVLHRAAASYIQRRLVNVHALHSPCRPNQVSKQQGDIAHAAAEVKHPHSFGDSRLHEEASRVWRQHRSLQLQPPPLMLAVAQYVSPAHAPGLFKDLDAGLFEYAPI